MSFQPSRPPVQRAAPRSAGPVLSVGRRVFVNSPGGPGKTVELTDDAGCSSAVLTDGTEVEIVAWRPRGSTGTRYRVQGTDGGIEGWLGIENLRPGLSVAPPPISAPSTGAKPASPRPGQRPGSVR